MIKAKIFKVERPGHYCSNSNCTYNPEIHYKAFEYQNWHSIRAGTTCLLLSMDRTSEIYCRPCIDVIYQQLKPVLNSKLWAFE